MKTQPAALAIALLFGVVSFGQTQELPTLNSLKLEFDVKRAELQKPIQELQTKYEEQLNQLLERVTGAGELENAIAVKAEIEGYKDGKSKPAGDDFPELKRLQGIYADAHAQRVATINKNLGPVVEDYKAKLLALQKALTKEKRLEEALAVKAVIDGIKIETTSPRSKETALEIVTGRNWLRHHPGSRHSFKFHKDGKIQCLSGRSIWKRYRIESDGAIKVIPSDGGDSVLFYLSESEPYILTCPIQSGVKFVEIE